MSFGAIVVGLSALSAVQARIANAGSAHLRSRNGLQPKNDQRCPGLGSPCAGNGECAPATGVCTCKYGWGGEDCSQTVPDVYEVTHVRDPDRQDMLGIYEMVPMYLQEAKGAPDRMKFIHYDPVSEGWAVSKLNSSCKDDICFFADVRSGPLKDLVLPPPKGYVYGNVDRHFYYQQLVWDDSEMYPEKPSGYRVNLAYTPDPNVAGLPPDLEELTGRYVTQPRFVHQKTGKYAIMPVNMDSPGKMWVFLELHGVGLQRHWRIVADARDPSTNRYTVPKGPWEPPELMLTLKPSCKDHITLDTCFALRDSCKEDSKDRIWVKSCCRQTCGTCATPASECKLPKTTKQTGFDTVLNTFAR